MQRERLEKTFLELIRLRGPSGFEEPVRAQLKKVLAPMGFALWEDKEGNLYGKRPGRGTPLLLCAHMDTVPLAASPHVVIRPDAFLTDGATALGADDRAGIAEILESVTSLLEEGKDPALEVFFTVREEKGLEGARSGDLTGFSAKTALIPDSSLPAGSLIVRCPFKRRYDVSFSGRSAHAAAGKDRGASALYMAARAVSRLCEYPLPEGSSFNVGSLVAEGPTNVVCPKSRFAAEARSFDRENLEALQGVLLETVESSACFFGGQGQVQIEETYPGYSLEPASPEALRFKEACVLADAPFSCRETMGGTDGSVLKSAGITPLVLGTGYSNPHSVLEKLDREDFFKAASVLYRYIDCNLGE